MDVLIILLIVAAIALVGGLADLAGADTRDPFVPRHHD